MPTSTHPASENKRGQSEVLPQYDKIGTSYTIVKQLPTEQIETFNLHAAVQPYLTKDSRVLDLASGTGHYTRKLVSEWGAASAVGVDISPTMVEASRKAAAEGGDEYEGKIEYLVGDAISLGRLDDDGFDLVIGSWLLNYASTEDELVKMFQTISANLNSDRGAFVGIVQFAVAAADLDGYAMRQNEEALPRTRLPPWRYEIRYLYPTPLAARSSSHGSDNTFIATDGRSDSEVGWKCKVAILDHGGENAVVEFESNHLPKEVFERAAKKGGMKGQLSWRAARPPVPNNSRGEVNDKEKEFWDEYFSFGAHFTVLVVHKGEGIE